MATPSTGLIGFFDIPMVQGAVFVDAGSVWNSGWHTPWVGSFGGGLRMGLGGIMVLRLDVARRTDWKTVDHDNHWEFTIGWNY